MNKIEGHIESIVVHDDLSMVYVNASSIVLVAVVIDNPQTLDYLFVGNPISLVFKETEVIIAKGLIEGISLQNRILGKLISIAEGKLLSKLIIDTEVGKITSIISSDAATKLTLKEGDIVTAMVKTTEMMLSK